MFDFFYLIPDVVWAALIASLLTLGGVSLSNRNSRIQTRNQLNHDSSQRNREREMALRQDVYLRACEGIAKGQNILIRLTNLELSEQEVADDSSVNATMLAQIQVVGTNETLRAVSTFTLELGSAYLELILKRLPIRMQKNNFEILARQIKRLKSNKTRHWIC